MRIYRRINVRYRRIYVRINENNNAIQLYIKLFDIRGREQSFSYYAL